MNLAGRIILVISCLMASNAYANFHSAKEGAKVFILQGQQKTARVIPLKSVGESDGTMMRMPDLGEVSEKDAVHKVSSIKSNEKDVAKSKVVLKLNAPKAEPVAKPLRFSKTKINGTLRLPRVKFARVGLPVDIREELPTLDFTSKSLKDSDF